MSKANAEDIFRSGVLVHLRIRKWGATAKADKSVFKDDSDKEIMRAVQDLLEDMSLLEQITTHRNQTKQYVYANSVPFPVDGLSFIPKHKIAQINEELKQRKAFHEDLVEQFVDGFETLRKQFKQNHPKRYRPEKYPTPEALKSKFEFTWTFRTLNVPGEELQAIDPEIYEAEVQKAKDEIVEMKEATKNIVASEIVKRLDALAKQCDGGKINSATISGINNFLEKFEDIWQGFFEQKEIGKMIEEVKVYLEGVDADVLRADDEFKNMVQKKAEGIVSSIEKMPDVKLNRGLDI